MTEETKKKLLRKPSRKTLLTLGSVLLIGAAAWLIFGQGMVSGGKKVDFNQLPKDAVPKSIETEVIPEYRELERALGCLVDGKVYVIVTRGEKPTAGYDVKVESMRLEKVKSGTNMKVFATFTEPKEGGSVAQIITYPYAVTSTNLKNLPTTIELIVKYED